MPGQLILTSADIKRLKLCLAHVSAFKAISQPVGTYAVTNPVENRSLDVSTATLAQLREIVGTLINDLNSGGITG